MNLLSDLLRLQGVSSVDVEGRLLSSGVSVPQCTGIPSWGFSLGIPPWDERMISMCPCHTSSWPMKYNLIHDQPVDTPGGKSLKCSPQTKKRVP